MKDNKSLLDDARWKLKNRVISSDKTRGSDNWPRITQEEAQALVDLIDTSRKR